MSKLEIQQLHIQYQDNALVNIGFDVTTSTALIGQSGSGKSLTLKSILNLLPSNLDKIFNYQCDFELNAQNIGFVPQNPFTSLSPLTQITQQFFCTFEHKIKMLKRVGLDQWVLKRFPSQLSGGQLQRVVLAIALSRSPKILLLDEPTTALDTNSKKTIIELLKNIQKELDILILFVTHDLESVKNLCDDIVIIKEGQIVERGNTLDTITNPQHPYTKELLDARFMHKEFRK
ncbi:MAG: ATP-binding cassette domain-containing protein [Campylobacterota bacterium]|nr:ATP-binding cassette domain-containing protein [Campylobacterota bacterium]